MADRFQFELVSPEKLLMSEEVEQVTVPGTEGDFGVLSQHAPTMSTIRPGLIDVVKSSGQSERIVILGGFADVSPNGLTVLAERAVPEADLTPEILQDAIEAAEAALSSAVSEAETSVAEQRLAQLKELG